MSDLILIVHSDFSFLNKVDLPEFLSIVNDSRIRLVYPSEHIDNQLIYEASLAVFEEMSELQLKLFENSAYNLGLHLGRDLLIEVEFLYNQVEIMQEGVMYELLDVTVQVRWDVVGLV